ncbi:hypothetical protein pb186bvf_002266 [Paramecium bursaria]
MNYLIAPKINVLERIHDRILQNRMVIQSEFAESHQLSFEETHESMKEYYKTNFHNVSAAFLILLKNGDQIQSRLVRDVDLDQIDRKQIIDLSIQAIFPKGYMILEETFPIAESSQSKILKTHITHVNISNVLVAMNNQFLTSQGQKKENKPVKKMDPIPEKRNHLNNYSEVQLPMKQMPVDFSNSLELENNSKSENVSRPKIKLKSKEIPQQPIQVDQQIVNQQSQESVKQLIPQPKSQSPPKPQQPVIKKQEVKKTNLLGFFQKK